MTILNDSPKRRGRPSSGKSHADIEKDSTKKYREKLAKSGKLPSQYFITPETKRDLLELKKLMDLSTAGDVIDVLVLQEIKRRK